MKVTIDINGNPVEITLTPDQINSIETQSKPRFKWKYEQSKTFRLGTTNATRFEDGEATLCIEHGRYRKTKEVAEQSLARNKRANRLEALAEQLGGLREFTFDKENWFIYSYKGEFMCTYTDGALDHEKIYMTKDCAIEICRMLNEGEFSLDGEL